MNISNASKQTARKQLENNWGKAIVMLGMMICVWLTFMLGEELVRMFVGEPVFNLGALNINASVISSLITCTALFLSLLILGPLFLGNAAWYWQNAKPENGAPPLSKILMSFGRRGKYGRTILFHLELILLKSLIALLLLLPGTSMLWIFNNMTVLQTGDEEMIWSVPFFLLGILLLILGALLYFLFIQRYFFAYYILGEDKSVSFLRAISLSSQMMKGYTVKVFKFKCGFWHLWLLCILVFPVLYVYPYYAQSCACFGRTVLADLRRTRYEKTETR